MYKDPEKQREANKQASQRRRDKGMTKQGMTVIDERSNEPSNVIPEGVTFRPACVTCKDMVDNNGVATCDIGGCDKPIPKDRLEAKPKRGKDIKCFDDLPVDVKLIINRLSMVDGKIDKTIKANRTAIAVNYQHLFPDKFHSTGITR